MKRRDVLRGLAVAGVLPGLSSVLGPLARRGADVPQSPFARFDPIALWLTSDIPGEDLGATPEYRVFKYSGVFRLAAVGPRRGQPLQFASMPCEVEPTGPAFAPGEQALFLSVQHPGERHGTRRSASEAPRGSNWPHRRLGAPPLPALVAIRRG